MNDLGILANINNADQVIQNEVISLAFHCAKCGKEVRKCFLNMHIRRSHARERVYRESNRKYYDRIKNYVDEIYYKSLNNDAL
jgi:hypothetical protein